MKRSILSLFVVALIATACGPESPDNLQQAGATADARLATAGPAVETAGANAGDAAATTAAQAGQAGATMGAAAGSAANAAATRINDRLVARVWKWEGTTGASAEQKPTDPTAYSLTFLPGGSVAVSADCKTAAGTFAAEDTTMQLNVKVSTIEPCAAGSLADTFIEELGQVATWNVEGERLMLGLANGAGSMQFVAP